MQDQLPSETWSCQAEAAPCCSRHQEQRNDAPVLKQQEEDDNSIVRYVHAVIDCELAPGNRLPISKGHQLMPLLVNVDNMKSPLVICLEVLVHDLEGAQADGSKLQELP